MNKRLKPLIMRVGMEDRPIEKTEGFILAGFPWEMAKIEHRPISSRKEMVSFSSELICLPLIRKPWEEITHHEDNWSDSAAFYGQILAYSDIEDSQPNELKGMSGGPIFSFYRENGLAPIKWTRLMS
jgi:hypothetical protein